MNADDLLLCAHSLVVRRDQLVLDNLITSLHWDRLGF